MRNENDAPKLPVLSSPASPIPAFFKDLQPLSQDQRLETSALQKASSMSELLSDLSFRFGHVSHEEQPVIAEPSQPLREQKNEAQSAYGQEIALQDKAFQESRDRSLIDFEDRKRAASQKEAKFQSSFTAFQESIRIPQKFSEREQGMRQRIQNIHKKFDETQKEIDEIKRFWKS